MYVQFPQTDSVLSSDGKRHRPDTLTGQSRRHDTTESMGGVRYQHHLLLPVLLRKLHRIRIVKLLRVQLFSALMTHGNRLGKRAHTNTQRSLNVTLIQLQNQRRLSGYLFHEPDDLIGKVSVMAAAEAHDLHILQMLIPGCQNRCGKHPGMIVIDHIQTAHGEIHLGRFLQRIRRQHRNTEAGEHLRQIMIDQSVILVRAGRQHNGVRAFALHFLADRLSGLE